jgi:hypothetical protein
MNNFRIHVFANGETQFIGNEFTIKVQTETLTKLNPLIDEALKLKPADNNPELPAFLISFFNYKFVRFICKNGFHLKDKDSLKPFIDDLISEFRTAFENKPN